MGTKARAVYSDLCSDTRKKELMWRLKLSYSPFTRSMSTMVNVFSALEYCLKAFNGMFVRSIFIRQLVWVFDYVECMDFMITEVIAAVRFVMITTVVEDGREQLNSGNSKK